MERYLTDFPLSTQKLSKLGTFMFSYAWSLKQLSPPPPTYSKLHKGVYFFLGKNMAK